MEDLLSEIVLSSNALLSSGLFLAVAEHHCACCTRAGVRRSDLP